MGGDGCRSTEVVGLPSVVARPNARKICGTRHACTPVMNHYVAHAAGRSLLFTTWAEGLELWRRIIAHVPGLTALHLMPDHIHLLHASDVGAGLRHALIG